MPSSAGSSSKQTPYSGIQTSSTGDRHIPESTRADGSVRKEIKIRPGYRPPEDVEVYKNRTAEAWKNRGSGGIPGAMGLKEAPSPESKGAGGKNAKRREARKRAKAAGGGDAETGINAGDEQKEDERDGVGTDKTHENGTVDSELKSLQTNGSVTPAPVLEESDVINTEAEKEKQARNLKKKLRQARDLKEKKESGGDLLPEQFAKVIKINELIRQLDTLGFDENGEAKEDSITDG